MHSPPASAFACVRKPIACIFSTRRAANGSKAAQRFFFDDQPGRSNAMTEKKFTRRDALKAGAAVAGLGVLQGADLNSWSQAWAQSAPWKPEKGAKLQLMGWKRFGQAKEAGFLAHAAAFTKATGVPAPGGGEWPA